MSKPTTESTEQTTFEHWHEYHDSEVPIYYARFADWAEGGILGKGATPMAAIAEVCRQFNSMIGASEGAGRGVELRPQFNYEANEFTHWIAHTAPDVEKKDWMAIPGISEVKKKSGNGIWHVFKSPLIDSLGEVESNIYEAFSQEAGK